MNQSTVTSKRTPLFDTHKSLGAKLIDFGGWSMPVDYGSITEEHLAVRTAAGLFDVSHMGEIEILGPQALELVQKVTSNDAARLKDGAAQYTALTYPEGSAVDDCVVHRLEEHRYLFCVNAANTEKDFEWMSGHNDLNAEVRNVSEDYAQLALQGPRAKEIISPLVEVDLSSLRYYNFVFTRCSGVECLLARTGYSGEDGFEVYLPPSDSVRLWNTLLDQGREAGLLPAGLGARNTLRLEAGYPLYGHELDETISLLEAGLGWICKLQKESFIGKEALLRQKKEGLQRRLVGLEMKSRAIARDGYPLYVGEKRVGAVTSGSVAPFLKKNIALAYVPVEVSEVGTSLEVGIRARRETARIVPLPFYKRHK
ncbi:MAG: glycine cleavage system aminomethyltransferase GcvT [Acidobacteria bacterium]|nr:glycine cleavage system aminomethyltransferase GcvT [Acidobacteriota bacterium]